MPTVVTSENLAEFTAQKLGLATDAQAVADEPVAEPQAEEPAQESSEPVVEVEGQSEPQAEEKAATEERKSNPKLEKRFSELTKQREIAKQEAEEQRKRAEDLEKRLAELERSGSPTQTFAEEEPQPHQFSDAFEYAKALSEWTAEQAVKKVKQEEAEAKLQAERQAMIDSWNKRQTAVMEELPDYEEVIAQSDVMVSDQVRDAILDSDHGPKILYHLAQNPEIAEKLATFSTVKALRELGKLEAQFEKSADTQRTEAKPVAKTSKAPAPINPLKAASAAKDTPIGSDGQFHGTYQQWKEARKAGKIR